MYAASYFSFYAEEVMRDGGRLVPSFSANKELRVEKTPVGVCSLITPWNFPSAMITRKLAPALAGGNTAVIKPSDLTPFSALALLRLIPTPEGVVNLVTCSAESTPEVGDMLSTHPLVQKVSFTGSTRVGKLLLENAARTVKRTSMELGGNAPFMVFDNGGSLSLFTPLS